MNLFERFDDLMDESVVKKLANASSDTSGNTYKALKGIYFTLIAGLIRRSNSSMGASMLYNQIQAGGEGGNLIHNLNERISQPSEYKELLKKGTKLLSQIFPAFKSPLVSMIGTYADIPKHATSNYSTIMSAIVVDMLDDVIKTNKFNAEGFTNYLREHHQQLFTDAPEGLLDVMIPALGLQELRNIRFAPPKKGANFHNDDEVQQVTSHIEPERNFDELTRKKSFPFVPVIGGVVLAALLGGGAWWYFTQYKPSEAPEETQEIDMSASADSLTPLKPDTTSMIIDSTINESSGNFSTFGEGLVRYLSDSTQTIGKVFPMDNVVFVAGTTNIDPESTLIVDELAEIMVNYPRLQVRIQGLDINGNKAVASKRAYAVKRELLNKGADNNRLDAIGLTDVGKNTVSIKVLTK